jgi:hypothetical protein
MKDQRTVIGKINGSALSSTEKGRLTLLCGNNEFIRQAIEATQNPDIDYLSSLINPAAQGNNNSTVSIKLFPH